MTDEFAEIKERRSRLLREGYLDARTSAAGFASMDNVGPKIGLDTESSEADRDEFMRLAQDLDQAGYIEGQADGYALFSITDAGRRMVENDLTPQQSLAVGDVTFNVGNAYGSIFGTQQNAELNVSFDFRTIEAELDRAEEEVERRGGPDAQELKEMLAEVRELRRNGGTLDKGKWARYRELLQGNGWITGPIAGSVLGWLTGA